MRRFLLQSFTVVVVLLLSSCSGGLDKVRVDDFRVDNISFVNSSKINIAAALKVVNPTGKKIVLKTAEFDVLTNGGLVFAHLRMPEPATVPAKSEDYQPLQLELRITNMMALLSGDINLSELNIEDFLVDGAVQMKSGVLSKTFKVKDMTLGQLLKSL